MITIRPTGQESSVVSGGIDKETRKAGMRPLIEFSANSPLPLRKCDAEEIFFKSGTLFGIGDLRGQLACLGKMMCTSVGILV